MFPTCMESAWGVLVTLLLFWQYTMTKDNYKVKHLIWSSQFWKVGFYDQHGRDQRSSQVGIVLKKIVRTYFLIDKLEVERERQEVGVLWGFESQSSPQWFTSFSEVTLPLLLKQVHQLEPKA